MPKFCKDHELSIWLTIVWLLMLGSGAVFGSNFISDHAAEVFGALVVVFTQNILKLREKGKDEP